MSQASELIELQFTVPCDFVFALGSFKVSLTWKIGQMNAFGGGGGGSVHFFLPSNRVHA